MKKFFALALALALTLALAVTCFAAVEAEIEAIDGTATNDVNVTYQAGGTSATVYGVDVVFDDMTFTYTAASQGTWDPDSHTYKDIAGATWSKTSANIKVTNHSNAAVAVTVSYANVQDYEGDVEASISNGTFTLDSAVGTQTAAAPNNTAVLNISGAAASTDNNTKIGTVTVTIATPTAAE